MKFLLLALAIVVAALWWRLRRLERELRRLGDKAIDWRLHLARRQEELEESLRSLGARPPADARRGAAAGEPLIQIRPTGRKEMAEP